MLRIVLVALTLALAASPTFAERLRHEYVAPEVLARFGTGQSESAIIGDGKMPDAIRRDGAQLDAPGPPGTDSPVVGPPDAPPPPDDAPSIPRPDEARPDRNTGADSRLKYHVIYNPSVAPLRRNVAFDRIEPDYRMTIADTPRRRMPIVGDRTPRPGRELFFGDMKVDFDGDDAPLPSVAPDMRILALTTEPAGVPVRFVRDGADNVYVRSPRRGVVRLIFLVDADSAYFSAPVPGNVLLGHQSGGAHTALPPRARQAAREVLDRLGISSAQPFDQGLDALVSWFRSFEAGPPPDSTNDIYRDLALGKTGVCRHRAFAFMITARAAGVPTRVVHNEAHAFVEVMAPDGRWRRVDLGGEAPELSIGGGDGGRLHQPSPDPFPKPEAWQQQYSSMLTQGAPPASSTDGPQPKIEGAPPGLGPGAQIEETLADGDAIDGAGGEGAAGDGAAEPGTASGVSPLDGDDGFSPSDGATAEVPLPDLPSDDPALAPAPAADDAPPLEPVSVELDTPRDGLTGYRGESITEPIEGRVSSAAEGPLAGVKVQLYLVPDGAGREVPLGTALTTDAQGRFSSILRLPATLRLGRYRLVAASEEGRGRQAGRSDAQ